MFGSDMDDMYLRLLNSFVQQGRNIARNELAVIRLAKERVRVRGRFWVRPMVLRRPIF